MPMKLIRSSMRPGQSGLVHRGVFETIHYHPIKDDLGASGRPFGLAVGSLL